MVTTFPPQPKHVAAKLVSESLRRGPLRRNRLVRVMLVETASQGAWP